MQVAFTLLFTRPGVPCIYYGDEMGMAGGDDPDCRRCVDWDRRHWQPTLWAHVQALAQLRRTRTEWQTGATLSLAQGPDWWAYARFNEHAATVVVVNRGDAARVQVPLHALPLAPKEWALADGGAVDTQGAVMRLRVAARGSCCVLSRR
jgi:alpha-glucosidase